MTGGGQRPCLWSQYPAVAGRKHTYGPFADPGSLESLRMRNANFLHAGAAVLNPVPFPSPLGDDPI